MFKYTITVCFALYDTQYTLIARSLEEAEQEASIFVSESGIDREYEYSAYYVSDAFDDFTLDTFKNHSQYLYFKSLFAEGHFSPQHVVAAACRSHDHKYVLVSARHWDGLMRSQSKVLGLDNYDFPTGEQGFIDQYGNYLSRTEATDIVTQNKQALRTPICGRSLYSENLY